MNSGPAFMKVSSMPNPAWVFILLAEAPDLHGA